ncbi:hypothetical protein F9C07_1092395 [Aspergillus flavus]|uniref:Uncharacterized protein n=2 Tax=Aspergillus flavus TaxID=5059 RepID=A0A7U2QXB0_ASPFN|nr:hypothetical protein BDV35DRAFT_211197 [Aspergillus flavus]QRD88316.1 hypothetical protein F9C07_1092395 [Aspergillus flavus]
MLGFLFTCIPWVVMYMIQGRHLHTFDMDTVSSTEIINHQHDQLVYRVILTTAKAGFKASVNKCHENSWPRESEIEQAIMEDKKQKAPPMLYDAPSLTTPVLPKITINNKTRSS